MEFYDVNGLKISAEQFIKIYGDSYFIGNKRVVKGVGQNSIFAENEIDKILREGIKNPKDIVHILAWKIGKLKHYECDKNEKFVYHKDWENAENMDVNRYGKKFEMKRFCDFVMENLSYMETECANKPQLVLNKLNEGSVNGIGTVYLITMLYFISKNKYPIYDRFAMKAIEAIVNDIKPGIIINEIQLPDKSSKKFNEIMDCEMNKYIKDLESVFGADSRKRKVDRALWVYGHMF